MGSYVSLVKNSSFKTEGLNIMSKILKMSPVEMSNEFLPDKLPSVSTLLGACDGQNLLGLPIVDAPQMANDSFSNKSAQPTFAMLRRYSTPVISS
jgi:hypothetical protein